MRTFRDRRHAAALAVAALSWGLLTACGAASAATGPANAPSPAPAPATAEASAAPAPAASPKERRPQLRLDSTAAEIRKYRLAYAACLKEHGMPSKGPWNDRAERAARQACKSKEPLLPPELSPKTNPHYAKSVRKEVACLKAHGFDVHLTPAPGSDPNAIGWRYGSVPGDDVDIEKIQNDCRVKAFGGGRNLAPAPM
jgi:hypothetical protein